MNKTTKYLIPLDDIAELLDVTPRRINQLVKTDAFPKSEKGKYDLVAAFRWMKNKMDATENGDATEREEKTRGVKLQNELREIEIKQRRGKLLPEEIVIPEINKMHHAVKTKLMAIGNDISLELAHTDEPARAKEIINGAITAALNDLDATGSRIFNAAKTKYTNIDDADLFENEPAPIKPTPKHKKNNAKNQ